MKALDYAKQLIEFNSVSRNSNVPITDHVEAILQRMGFVTERVEYLDKNRVKKANLLARKGSGTGGLCFFTHTDVVPAENWFFEDHGPFTPTIIEDKLYGRGSCDMKGPIGCVLEAASQYESSQLSTPLYVVCTADEEVGYGGVSELVTRSEMYKEMVQHQTRGIITEPTMLEVIHAHKGSYGFTIVSHGKAAHSSTRKGKNANLAMIPFLAEMKTLHEETERDTRWHNTEFDPPTVCWNIGINDHTPAINITPPQSVCTVYFRPMPGMDVSDLIQRARNKAEECGIEFRSMFQAEPMYVDPQSPFVREVLELTGTGKAHTVGYGTDGALLTELANKVVCGPGDIAQAHTHDEWITLEQLEKGTELYSRMIRRWCCQG